MTVVKDLSAYIHVPFCAVRCGYCDFNTYTADELRGATRAGYPGDVAAEIRLAREVLGELRPRGSDKARKSPGELTGEARQMLGVAEVRRQPQTWACRGAAAEVCREEALPLADTASVMCAVIAATASGSMGVVAAWSR